MKMTVSFSKGKKSETSIKHNNRSLEKDFDFDKKGHVHIKQQYTSQNRVLKHESIRDAYKDLFGDAVDQYNEKQKRKDRKIKDFYQHIKKSGKQQTQFEFIAQVGNKGDFEGLDRLEPQGRWQQAADLLQEYEANFEKRHPQMHVYNAVIHMDEEGSPHLHMNIVPVATGYKRGVAVQPSLKRVLSQEGYEVDPRDSRAQFNAFREQEQQELAKLLQDRGIGRKAGITNHLRDVHEYKEAMRQVEDAQQAAKTARLKAGKEIAQANRQAKEAQKNAAVAVKKQMLDLQHDARGVPSSPDSVVVYKSQTLGLIDKEATESNVRELIRTAKEARNAREWADDQYQQGYAEGKRDGEQVGKAFAKDDTDEAIKDKDRELAQLRQRVHSQAQQIEDLQARLAKWKKRWKALQELTKDKWEKLRDAIESRVSHMEEQERQTDVRRQVARRDQSRER